MEIKPGISASLYISMILFIAAFSGQNSMSNQVMEASAVNAASDTLIGKWELLEDFQDRGNGRGKWVPADPLNKEVILFFTNGSFSASGESPLAIRAFNRYKLVNKGMISFTSTAKGYAETYPYTLETYSQLLIYPLCRENCMRRYKLINKIN